MFQTTCRFKRKRTMPTRPPKKRRTSSKTHFASSAWNVRETSCCSRAAILIIAKECIECFTCKTPIEKILVVGGLRFVKLCIFFGKVLMYLWFYRFTSIYNSVMYPYNKTELKLFVHTRHFFIQTMPPPPPSPQFSPSLPFPAFPSLSPHRDFL